MDKATVNQSNHARLEQLKKEQKKVRKAGIVLLIISVILMPTVSMIDYRLVGISGILATIGGILTARSYVHVKYRDINNKK